MSATVRQLFIEHHVPNDEFKIECDDQVHAFVAVGYDLEQMLSGFLLQRNQADFVDDHKFDVLEVVQIGIVPLWKIFRSYLDISAL